MASMNLMPSEESLKMVSNALESKYGVVLPPADLERFTSLVKMLQWWDSARRGNDPVSEQFATELSRIFSELKGVVPKDEEISKDAQVLLSALTFQEVRQIVRELTTIIIENRPVPFNVDVQHKLDTLLRGSYRIELDADQLAQLIQYLYRVLWAEDGLDSDLGECIDSWESQGLIKPAYETVEDAMEKALSKIVR